MPNIATSSATSTGNYRSIEAGWGGLYHHPYPANLYKLALNYKDSHNRLPARVEGTPNDVARAFRRQISQIITGGLPVLARKAHTLMGMTPDLPGALLALPVVLLVRLIRPLILIRFGPIRSPNFGHFAGEPEVYLSKRELGLDEPRAIDFLYYTSRPGTQPISNLQLKVMWDRTLRVNRLVRWPDWINRSIPGGKKHMIPPNTTRDIHGCLTRTQPHLSFTKEEELRGREGLMSLGIPDNAPFIAFHARDPAWLEYLAPGIDYSYHNHRDSNVKNYLPAIEMLVERGYYAVRMGSVVKDDLETSNEKIIDYAANGSRTDFLDIYLGAKCRFFIGSAAGITELPKIFRKPILSVNQIPLEITHSWAPHDIFIPKKIWFSPDARYLTFRESLESSAGSRITGSQLSAIGLYPEENTPEEITAAALEMEQRISGEWVSSGHDEELQERFWKLFEYMPMRLHAGEPLHGVIASRIGAEFLRSNQELLNPEPSWSP